MKALGIDTSNYTTSCAICADGEIIENVRLPLAVAQGKGGLRQSDALFLHTKALPQAIAQLKTPLNEISAVGVSSRPRSVDGSYMPCFLAGDSCAEILGKALQVPVFRTSHQDGHIYAGAYSSGFDIRDKSFYALHLSGGTLEVLDVSASDRIQNVRVCAEALDLTAGQLIDRVGIMLGLQFPCGAEISRLAEENTEKLPRIKSSLKGTDCNLSGVYNMAEKYKAEGREDSFIAAFVLEYIIKTIDAMLTVLLENDERQLLFCGGVSSSTVMKKYFVNKYSAYFAHPQFSADNASGCALYAYHCLQSEMMK